MAEIKNIYEQNIIVFYFTYTYPFSRKSAWKYRFAHRSPNPRSKLETLPKMEKVVANSRLQSVVGYEKSLS